MVQSSHLAYALPAAQLAYAPSGSLPPQPTTPPETVHPSTVLLAPHGHVVYEGLAHAASLQSMQVRPNPSAGSSELNASTGVAWTG